MRCRPASRSERTARSGSPRIPRTRSADSSPGIAERHSAPDQADSSADVLRSTIVWRRSCRLTLWPPQDDRLEQHERDPGDRAAGDDAGAQRLLIVDEDAVGE
jgi:hypothetical protein